MRWNDLVLIADDNAPRNTWPMGRIVDVFPGPDGRVRTINLRPKNPIKRRPVAKVCLLEAAETHNAGCFEHLCNWIEICNLHATLSQDM